MNSSYVRTSRPQETTLPTLTDTILSAETVQSGKASLASLDTLMQIIPEAAKADDGINSDEGVQALFTLTRQLRSQFSDPNTSDPNEVMPAEIVTLFSQEIIPALADITTELNELWDNVSAAVRSGEGGAQLVNGYLDTLEVKGSAAMRISSGLDKLRKAAMSASFG